jgi:hypothetical protein
VGSLEASLCLSFKASSGLMSRLNNVELFIQDCMLSGKWMKHKYSTLRSSHWFWNKVVAVGGCTCASGTQVVPPSTYVQILHF